MEPGTQDVQAIVPPAAQGTVVESGSQGGDDKDKNFAELRKQLADKDAEIARLKEGKPASDDRSLGTVEDKPIVEKAPKPDPLQAVFDRDKREAVRLWNKQHSVSPDLWAKIKDRVSLNGDETVSEIQDKISDAYSSLPEVQQEREERIRNEERQKVMRDFTDDDLDLGTGGSGGAGGDGGGSGPRLNSKERSIASAFGLTKEEIAGIDKDADPNEWKILDPAQQGE